MGLKVTIGNALDPASVKRTYEDIERILNENKKPYTIHEEHTPQGTFKSYIVET